MKYNLKSFSAFIGLIGFMLLACFYFYTNLSKDSQDESCNFHQLDLFVSKRDSFKFLATTTLDSSIDFVASFPYDEYLSSGNWRNLNGILRDLNTLDSGGVDPDLLDMALCDALTTKNSQWVSANYDTLNQILKWAEPMLFYSQSGERHPILFQAIGGYWVSQVSQRLQQILEEDEFAYLNCKFKYLRTRTCELSGACGDQTPNLVKAFDNLIKQNWSYLLTRFRTHTGILFKSVVFLGSVLTLIAYYALIIILIRKR